MLGAGSFGSNWWGCRLLLPLDYCLIFVAFLLVGTINLITAVDLAAKSLGVSDKARYCLGSGFVDLFGGGTWV